MSAFLTKLSVELIEDNSQGMWELKNPLVYQSDLIGNTIVIPAGFKTDFATVPRLPLFYDVLGNIARAAATVHDWMYYTQTYPRKTCDQVLSEAMQASGIHRWKGGAFYIAVRLFGASHYGTNKSPVTGVLR